MARIHFTSHSQRLNWGSSLPSTRTGYGTADIGASFAGRELHHLAPSKLSGSARTWVRRSRCRTSLPQRLPLQRLDEADRVPRRIRELGPAGFGQTGGPARSGQSVSDTGFCQARNVPNLELFWVPDRPYICSGLTSPIRWPSGSLNWPSSIVSMIVS